MHLFTVNSFIYLFLLFRIPHFLYSNHNSPYVIQQQQPQQRLHFGLNFMEYTTLTQLRFQKRNENPLRKADVSSSSHEFAMPRKQRVLTLVNFTLHLKVFSLNMGNTQRRRMGIRYCCRFHSKWEILMNEAAYVKRLLVESKIFIFGK